MAPDFPKWMWDAIPAIISGGAGGLVRWLTLKEPLRDGVTSIVVGVLCSLYMGPLGTAIVDPVFGRLIEDPMRRENLGGFLIGMGGIVVVGFVIDLWRLRVAAISKKSSGSEIGK